LLAKAVGVVRTIRVARTGLGLIGIIVEIVVVTSSIALQALPVHAIPQHLLRSKRIGLLLYETFLSGA